MKKSAVRSKEMEIRRDDADVIEIFLREIIVDESKVQNC